MKKNPKKPDKILEIVEEILIFNRKKTISGWIKNINPKPNA